MSRIPPFNKSANMMPFSPLAANAPKPSIAAMPKMPPMGGTGAMPSMGVKPPVTMSANSPQVPSKIAALDLWNTASGQVMNSSMGSRAANAGLNAAKSMAKPQFTLSHLKDAYKAQGLKPALTSVVNKIAATKSPENAAPVLMPIPPSGPVTSIAKAPEMAEMQKVPGIKKIAFDEAAAAKVLSLAKKIQLPKASARIMPLMAGGPELTKSLNQTIGQLKMLGIGAKELLPQAIATFKNTPGAAVLKRGKAIFPGGKGGPMGVEGSVRGIQRMIRGLLPELEKVPAGQQKMLNAILKGHELDEVAVKGSMGAGGMGHRSPDVIFREHNRVATLPRGYDETKKFMSGMRGFAEAPALMPKEIEYGTGPRLSRHARRHLTENINDKTIAATKKMLPKQTAIEPVSKQRKGLTKYEPSEKGLPNIYKKTAAMDWNALTGILGKLKPAAGAIEKEVAPSWSIGQKALSKMTPLEGRSLLGAQGAPRIPAMKPPGGASFSVGRQELASMNNQQARGLLGRQGVPPIPKSPAMPDFNSAKTMQSGPPALPGARMGPQGHGTVAQRYLG